MQVSSVNNALPALTEALGSSPSEVQWVLSGYTLAIGVVLVPAGRLGDIFGRSSLFMIGLTIFTLASLAAGLAPTTLVLNILRVFQGIGAGVLSPQTTGLIVQYFEGKAHPSICVIRISRCYLSSNRLYSFRIAHWLVRKRPRLARWIRS